MLFASGGEGVTTVAVCDEEAAFIIVRGREPCGDIFRIGRIGLDVGRCGVGGNCKVGGSSGVGRGLSVGGGSVKGVYGWRCVQAAIETWVVSRREEGPHGLGGGMMMKACELRMVFD